MNVNRCVVDFNKALNRFEIYVPFALNEIAKAFPNRVFDRAKRVWAAPAIRVNVRHIKEIAHEKLFDLTPAALGFVNSFDVDSSGYSPTDKFPKSDEWFKTRPRDYQRKILDYFWGSDKGALFAEMGTGKSKVAVDMAAAAYEVGRIDTALVISPASLKSNWVEQLSDHCPCEYESFVVDLGVPKIKERFDKFLSGPRVLRFVMVGVESMSVSKKAADIVKSLVENSRCFVVVDESHSIKNPRATRTKSIINLTKGAVMKWAMTGTSISNGIEDLYSQFAFLDPGIIGVGSFEAFKARYTVRGGFEGKRIVGYRNIPELMGLIKPWTMELKKKDVLPELPDKIYERREIELTGAQKQLYKSVKEKGLADLRGIGADFQFVMRSILEVSLALQQITGGFLSNIDDERVRHVTPILEWKDNPKILALLEIIEGMNGSVIVWAKYVEEIRSIISALSAVYGPDSVVAYYGAVNQAQRDENKKRFLLGESRFFVGNPITGGSGLTLNVSSTVVYFSNSFRMVDRLQSEDRNHRIGQKNPVTYIDLVAKGTIDVSILSALKRKKGLLGFVQESMSGGVVSSMDSYWSGNI